MPPTFTHNWAPGSPIGGGAIDPAGLFWLVVFADEAASADGSIRSDRWVGAGLATAKPGLDATAPIERGGELVTDYDLFELTRQDQAQFSGAAYDLNWQRVCGPAPAARSAATCPRCMPGRTNAGPCSWRGNPQAAALEQILAGMGCAAAPSCSKPCTARRRFAMAGCGNAGACAHALRVPLADVYGVTEFYDMFHTHPVGHEIMRVCRMDRVCWRGAG